MQKLISQLEVNAQKIEALLSNDFENMTLNELNFMPMF